MKEFSIKGFADHLASLAGEMPIVETVMLDHIGDSVVRAAKEKIGEYHAEAGPFVAWEPLAESTKEERVREGFTEDEPGLRTGEMRESITKRVTPPEVHIGSNNDDLFWFEFGTKKQPPRSVIGAAAFQQAPYLAGELGKMLELHTAGGKIEGKAVDDGGL